MIKAHLRYLWGLAAQAARHWKWGLIPAALLLFYLGCINYLEPFDAGIAWNPFTGKVTLQEKGLNLSPPWVFVTVVDTRPQRVCLTTASRAVNCRLVQFQEAEYKALVEAEGWYYYWWYNRLSFNFGYHDEYRGVRDLLRGYGFSVKPFLFLVVLEEYAEGGE